MFWIRASTHTSLKKDLLESAFFSSLVASLLPIIMKKKKLKIFPQKSDTFNNVVNILISLLGINMALDSICYIFTGKNFDKFLKDKFKKENPNKDS